MILIVSRGRVLMQRHRSILLALAALLVSGLAVLVGLDAAHASRQSAVPSISVGLTADAAWTCMRSFCAGQSRGMILGITREARTRVQDIQCDVNYHLYLRTNYLFATHHFVYALGTRRGRWQKVKVDLEASHLSSLANEARQPTPGVCLAAQRASLSRRGCADRSAVVCA